jgi:uncharacterized protein
MVKVDIARLKDLSRRQCLSLLSSVRVGRVGVSIGALPAIMPVNFLVLGEAIVFRTVPGTKLDAATAHAVVAFETDDYAPDGAWGWSVLIQGVASEITEGPEHESMRVALLKAWAFPDGLANRIVRIDPTFMSGKGFGPAVRALTAGLD